MSSFKEVFREKRINRTRQRYEQNIPTHKEKLEKLPIQLLKLLADLKIYDVKCGTERAKRVIFAFVEKKYSKNTAKRYFQKLRSAGIFFDSTIQIDTIQYDAYQFQQIRVPVPEEFDKFLDYIKNYYFIHIDRYTKPLTFNVNVDFLDVSAMETEKICDRLNKIIAIKFAYYTLLRSSEICSLTNEHLYQLSKFTPVLQLKRKYSTEWNVIYYDDFIDLIAAAIRFYSNYIDLYTKYKTTIELFGLSSRSLHDAIQALYVKATGQNPPKGFGLHTLRVIVATKIVECRGDIETARVLLGHKQIKTTRIYTKYDALNCSKVIKEATAKDPFYMKLNAIFK